LLFNHPLIWSRAVRHATSRLEREGTTYHQARHIPLGMLHTVRHATYR